MSPFLYPPEAHVRRHGPRGYRDPESFRPWLRDEFCFRCVFCLRREQWDRATSMQIEHFLSVSQHPARALEYDNLLYTCGRCNLAKSNQAVPDPTKVLLDRAVSIQPDGTLAAADSETITLIDQLRLNCPEMVHFRRLWLEIIAMAVRVNPQLYVQLMGFPEDLPDLRASHPPQGNDRPDGIANCWLLKRERGELPPVY